MKNTLHIQVFKGKSEDGKAVDYLNTTLQQ